VTTDPKLNSCGEAEHALLSKVFDQLSRGLIDRREFIRFATLLGVAAGAAAVTAT